jgi:parvulin-like peptidyl-prolyl isomerase
MMERKIANHAGRSLWSAALPGFRRLSGATTAARWHLSQTLRWRSQQEWNTDDTDLTDYTDQRLPGSDPYNPSDPSDQCSILGSKAQPCRSTVSTAGPKCPNLSRRFSRADPACRSAPWAKPKQRLMSDGPGSISRLVPLGLCFLAFSFLGISCRGVHDSTPVIGSVNGHQIHRSAIESFMKVKMGELTLGDAPDSLRSQMLDEYIRRRLVLDEAARLGLSITDAEIEQAVQDNPQTRSAAAQEEARKEFASDLLVAKYYRQVVLRDVRVSPEEAQSYIEQNRARLVESPVSYVREIRVENREEAERLRRDIADGKQDFADAARQHSQAPNAEQGGLMGYAKGQLPDVLEKAIDPLKPGDVSPVVQSSFGFHIFKLEQRTQPRAPDDKRSQSDERRSQLIEEAIERKNQHAVDEAIDRLVSSAAITINTSTLGFTYVGRLGHN